LGRSRAFVPWRICRPRLDSSTRSESISPSVPTPAAARYSATGEPSPPAPTTATPACRRRVCPAPPTSGRVICRLYGRRSASEKGRRGLTPGLRAGRLAPSGDGQHDGDLVAVLDHALATLEEADVLLVQVDVDESPEVSRLVAEPVAEPRKPSLEIVDQLSDVLALGVDLSRSAGVPAERRGNADEHWHPRFLPNP